MSAASSFNDPAGRELLAMLRKARRNTFGDPKYHSGRKKKEFASPYLEFLDKLEKAARTIHARQGAFHGGWFDLANVLLDDRLLGLRQHHESGRDLLPRGDLRGQMRV